MLTPFFHDNCHEEMFYKRIFLLLLSGLIEGWIKLQLSMYFTCSMTNNFQWVRNPARQTADRNCCHQNLIQTGKVMLLGAMMWLFVIIALIFFRTNVHPPERTICSMTSSDTSNTSPLCLWIWVLLIGCSSFHPIVSHHPHRDQLKRSLPRSTCYCQLTALLFNSFLYDTNKNKK